MTTNSLDLARKDIDDMTGLDSFYKLFESKVIIKKLSLSQNNIEYLDCKLELWSSVEELYLDNNKIKMIPGSIGQLTKLIKLDLSSNDLRSISSKIDLLSKLEVLDLSNNTNLKNLPPEIVNLKALKTLAIGNTKLTMDSLVIKAMIATNPYLEIVDRIINAKKPTSLKSSFRPMGQVF